MKARFLLVLLLCPFFGIAWSAEDLPTRLEDDVFWDMVTDFSEPGGTFLSDNFVSNELAIQNVLDSLAEGRTQGGAYIGVGPEQNYTYIVALEPQIAFLFDIRRQAIVEHLMYKALVELSVTRADFLSRLFSRPLPPALSTSATITELFDALASTEPDPSMFYENIEAIKRRLINYHNFQLLPEDESALDYVFRAFYVGGPDLTYAGPNRPIQPPRPGRRQIARILPTYEELMTDTDPDGRHRSYLGTEENFLKLRRLHDNNLIVPIVGNFAGPSAIRTVGEYLKQHNTTVTAFYTSNVEQYLFMNDQDWRNFYLNVSTLPVDSKSVFIRPLINNGRGYSAAPTLRVGFRWDTVLFSIPDLLSDFNSGLIQTYYDVIREIR